MSRALLRKIQIGCVALALSMPFAVQGAQVDENPDGATMVADLLVARPIGLVLFGLGAVTYVATLPFSVFGGNVEEAGKALIVKPAEEVFVRCLGCRTPGRKEKIRD